MKPRLPRGAGSWINWWFSKIQTKGLFCVPFVCIFYGQFSKKTEVSHFFIYPPWKARGHMMAGKDFCSIIPAAYLVKKIDS